MNSLRAFKPGYSQFCVIQFIQFNDSLRQYAGLNYWSDPDMLKVSNGMTESEGRAHFTIWCMMTAPYFRQ